LGHRSRRAGTQGTGSQHRQPWLDLAKRRDGQKWIVAIRLNVQWGNLQLLVPSLVIDEFQRNRPRVEASMTSSVADRFKQMRRDFDEYGGETYRHPIWSLVPRATWATPTPKGY
jgi:hypothetical protein